MKRDSGFTIVELIIVIIILGIIGAIAGGMMQIGFDSWNNSMARSSDSVNAMTTMRYFYQVIPKAIPSTISKATKKKFNFSESGGNKIKIKYTMGSQKLNIQIGNSENHCITNVSKFKCSYSQIDRTPWNSALSMSLIRRVQLDFTVEHKSYTLNYFIRNE